MFDADADATTEAPRPLDPGIRGRIHAMLERAPAGTTSVLAAWADVPVDALHHSRWHRADFANNPHLDWPALLTAKRSPIPIHFRRLSRNTGDWWTPKLIAAHADEWDWARLSANPALPWSEELLDRFRDKWVWKVASLNRGVPWTAALMKRHEANLVVSRLAANPTVPWTRRLVRRMSRALTQYDPDWYPTLESERPESVTPGVRLGENGWYHLQQNPAVPWAKVVKHLPDPNWELLAGNSGFPWTLKLIRRHRDALSWSRLSRNRGLDWTLDLFGAFTDRWSLFDLAGNSALPWADDTDALLRYFDTAKVWHVLSGNPGVRWTADRLRANDARLVWGDRGISRRATLTEDLLDTFADRLDWNWGTTTNRYLPWSASLLRRHAHRWNWERLGFNRSLPWSPKLIAALDVHWVVRSFVRHVEGWNALAPAIDEEYLRDWSRGQG
jgi:hypothetical protein